MAGEKKLKREPFAYISKRDGVSLTYRITVRAAAIVLALVVCGIVTKVLTGDNPADCSLQFMILQYFSAYPLR